MRITHQDTAAILSHSRAIGAPKREVPKPAQCHAIHPMALAMSEVYRYEPNAAAQQGADTARSAAASERVPNPAGAAAPFKVGDRVRVVCRVEEEPGWDNEWVGTMDGAIGQCGEVERVDEQGVRVSIKGLTEFSYPQSALRLATQSKPFALWRRPEQIDASERTGVWMHRQQGFHFNAAKAGSLQFSGDYEFMRAAQSVKPGDAYDASLYVRPGPDGWFSGEPPASLGRHVSLRMDDADRITAWRPLP